MSGQQTQLPFATAEATCAERKILLWFAVQQSRVDLRVATLCQWVFDKTSGGFDGQAATASCEQLATMPWGLCCSISTARRTVQEAKKVGLLVVEPVCDSAGRQTSNSLAIDWIQIRHMLGVSSNHPRMGGQLDSPGYQLDTPPSQLDSPGCQVEQQIEQQTEIHGHARPSHLIPAGETPRVCVRAPSFLPSSSLTSTYEGTKEAGESPAVTWGDLVPLGNQALRIFSTTGRLTKAERWTFARLIYLAVTTYGEDWLLDGFKSAARRKPRDLDYVKGTLANTSGDRGVFFARFDSLRQDAGWYRPKQEQAKGDDG
jgi:hypothetical protein